MDLRSNRQGHADRDDKEIYNGDIGYVSDVDPEAGEISVTFDGRAVTYGLAELDVLVPAYWIESDSPNPRAAALGPKILANSSDSSV